MVSTRKVLSISDLSSERNLKGGDPSAPSSTDTLLRLNPHRWIYLSPWQARAFGYPQLC